MIRALQFSSRSQLKYVTNIFALRCSSSGDKGPRSKPDISTLLKDLEEKKEEPKRTFQNLIKNETLKRKEETNKIAEELSKKRHNEGKDFLFNRSLSPKKSSKLVEPIESMDSSTTLDFLNEEKPLQDTSLTNTKPFEVSELKHEIAENQDDRSITKLMSALIDEVDQDLSDPEDKLKALMKAMGKRKPRKHEINEEREMTTMYQRKERRHKGKMFSLTHGETTELFTDMTAPSSEHTDEISLYEKQWVQDLQNLLPENLPRNSFEVMMLDIDRQWRFPIDNEQDIGIEEETSFEEHVFLDHYLDEFPEEGPVRRFMELVITGLQQNPHLTIDQKVDQIAWFKSYFEKFPDSDLAL